MCSVNFNEDLRYEICKSFWQLGDYRRQKDFILMNVKSASPKRRRKKEPTTENSKVRTNSKSFFLLNKRVCQSFFLKTLSISNGPLIKAFKHKNVYTNFFDGDDKRGKHTPSNKLSEEIVESVVNHLEQHSIKNSKSKKRVICDPEIKSLRHLFSLFKENHNESSPSYTSFKRIFNENSFAFPPERVRTKAAPRVTQTRSEELQEIEIFEGEADFIEEQILETVEASQIQDISKPEQPQQKVIISHVPDTSKFFSNPSQVYEIQFIEIPIPTTSSIIKQSWSEVKCLTFIQELFIVEATFSSVSILHLW